MSFPSVNLASIGAIDESSNYANKTNSRLIFESQVTKTKVIFKAYIKSLSHEFQSTWNSENVFGRMDPIATFQGTVRKVSVSFDILAGSLKEAKENVKAIGSFTSMLYPGYKSNPSAVAEEGVVNEQQTLSGDVTGVTANSISRSPLIKMKLANLVQDSGGGLLLGWIDGLSFDQTIESGVFIQDGMHYPKQFSVSVTLNVLHQHDLGFDENNEWNGDPLQDGGYGWPFGGRDE
tara:strand:- start:2537 stop:3238 length:702 start_codon:yes stop_codon:yes gene_type:complete